MFEDDGVPPASLTPLDPGRSVVEQLRERVAAMEHRPARAEVPTLPGLAEVVPLHAGATYGVDSASLALALAAGAWPVVLVAIGSSVIAVFFYIRMIRVMFFVGDDEPADREAVGDGVGAGTRTGSTALEVHGSTALLTREKAGVTTASTATAATIALCALVTLALGVAPGPLLELAAGVGGFLR